MAFLIPFDSSNIFGGLHESLYADHSSLSSFLAVTATAVYSHLWNYPENLSCLLDVYKTLDATCLQLFIPFLVPILLWLGLERFLKQSEGAFKALKHIVMYERGKLLNSHDDIELKQCLELMKKNRQDYEELLRLCDQFPGQRAKADLERLKKVKLGTTGSGDIMRCQCPSDLSDSTDTDWNGANEMDDGGVHRNEKIYGNHLSVMGTDSDKTFPGCTDEDDDDTARLSEAAWKYDCSSRPSTAKGNLCDCDF